MVDSDLEPDPVGPRETTLRAAGFSSLVLIFGEVYVGGRSKVNESRPVKGMIPS